MKEISWLHLSDLHAGMHGQPCLWPNLKHALFNDLRSLHSTNGPWDFVIFSGDLTQRASVEDYAKLTEIIVELWAVFKELGFNPAVLCVPGNHDLVRPPKFQAEVMVLDEWWQKPSEFHSEFWQEGNSYLNLVNKNFENYSAWLQSIETLGIINIATSFGSVAGDSSGIFKKDGLTIGVIGLNSAWLQLGNRRYKGFLHVDVNQILNITENDPEAWCAKNDFNLLVTHHPLDWLEEESRAKFQELIAPDGRFTCHLFGHMHEPNYKTTSTGGSLARREVQAASLFGLEKILSTGVERIHGYSYNRISSSDEASVLSFWPRKDRVVAGNRRVVGADPFFEFEEIKETLDSKKIYSPLPATANPGLPQVIKLDELAATSEGVLDAFTLKIISSPEHSDVRRMESDKIIEALGDSRCVWLISEWGMGEDGFLWALQQKYKSEISQYITIKMADFKNLRSFQEDIKRNTGHSIEVLCGALENVYGAILLLDDIPVDTNWTEEQTQETLKLAKIFLDFAPYINVIMRARVSPHNSQYTQVELKALDQGDTKSYILAHSNGGAKYSTYEAVDKIYRNTDGIPTIIDSVLKNLSVMGLSGLSAISSDVAGKEVITSTGNEALKQMILAISNSPDPALKRCYELLKALTIFPQGEQLQRIKYLNQRTPFFPSSVHELMSRGLVSTVEVESLGTYGLDVENTIIVNRLAREAIINMMNPAQFKDLNRKAADLYFGEKIGQSGFKPPRSLRFDKAGRSNPEISNAAVIIQRLAVDAASTKDTVKINHVVSLIAFHAKALHGGSYFKASGDFFEDIFPIISEYITDRQHAYLTSLYASSLRMVDGDGYSEQARDMILGLELDVLDKSDQIHCELNLALCHHSLKSTTEAIASAEKVISLDRRSSQAIQARWIILQNQPDDPDHDAKYAELSKTAVKRKTHVVVASIALERARKETNPATQRTMYENIISEANNNGDTYNAIRAIVALGGATTGNHTQHDKTRLIQAYHYLYKGGFLYLFNSCHHALWRIFEQERDLTNLLQLFKYSSLVWRLRGTEKPERDAVHRLQAYVTGQAIEVSASSHTMAYYIFRSNNSED